MQKVTGEYKKLYGFIEHFNILDIRAPVSWDSGIISQAGLECSVIFCFVCVYELGVIKRVRTSCSGVIPRSCFEL